MQVYASGGNVENIIYSDLMVDSWKVKYEDNPVTGESDIVEEYSGQTNIMNTDDQKYLGFVLSSRGDNMANIRKVKKKYIGIISKISKRPYSLKLQTYYFECAVIFMNTMLRPSFLYAADMYYSLKESELRQLERIEEGYLKRNITPRPNLLR